MSTITQFMDHHFRHFNARETLDAAKAWNQLLDDGGQMFLTMAGAMSTAEIGIILSRMIRAGKVHTICCTAANLEEDLFNLFNHNEYKMVPNYRDLSPEAEKELYDDGFNRVTDTCIPEGIMRQVQREITQLWKKAAEENTPKFPYEFMYELLDQPGIEQHFQVPAEDSWVLAAKEMGVVIYTPGWEDCTLGNIFVSEVIRGNVKSHAAIRHGTEQMEHLAKWYIEMGKKKTPIGFFQIGGGIAGDFPICVVPMLIQDLELEDTPYWAYFCQISDSTTSYGSYSGAVPNEKITWGKLDIHTPKFMINSDAAIVAPLIFSYVLGD
ncbi:MAG: deoxyhypusine [Desulfovibrionaceae bacterium]|nr:MAG: deoxyhypusine [Desulfovibrionaceae bacterium]